MFVFLVVFALLKDEGVTLVEDYSIEDNVVVAGMEVLFLEVIHFFSENRIMKGVLINYRLTSKCLKVTDCLKMDSFEIINYVSKPLVV